MEVSVLASYLLRSIAFRGSLAPARSSSACMAGEKLAVGMSGIRGWIVELASGEREEDMSAWAAEVSVSVGARSTSGFVG